MNIMEFIGWVVFFYIGWQLLKSWIFVQQIKQRVEDALDKAEAVHAVEKEIIALKFEHIEENGYSVVLAYGKNNRFLGQGATELEIEKSLQQQYPKHKLVVVNEKAIIQRVLDPVQTTNG